ncbi:DUF1329 domain-containing protein [Solimonas sp. K1W22B-7]|uniref:DUF1329 domain-containing protein n=1 Tax=Solimonas sp. K1W22B-7 TaxID=2303331 RepID=UPI000E3308E7|nr:DUF1329 domain-containing protein [Solimonas sp. K1W22B-7]AXQ31070.1 DUF1329 domain-containing protein [Solimonas sp. K1W22B-7]
MHIRKFDFDYGRRQLMKNVAIGAGAGVLMPLTNVMAAAGDIGKAYPDELLSIEMYTKGKIKTGDMITSANVEVVKDLLDPIIYEQVKTMGRKIKIKATQRDYRALFPGEFYEKTLRNMSSNGNAKFDANNNVVTQEGKPWHGGLPFPDPKTGMEIQANMAMSWGRGDYNQYTIKETDINPDGGVAYNYDIIWSELQVQARMDGKVFKDMNDLLRFQTILFTASADVAGSSFLSTWYYDQRKFPELYGYLPQFRRVRQFPTNQRFEPLIPGVTWFLTDPWAAGDPMLTWGDYKIIERKPMLGAFNTTWSGDRPNWEKGVHGGAKGITFYDTEFELAPEVAILESKPVGYPRAPVGRRLAYVDVRNCIYCGNIRYDRQNKPWVSFETGFGQYKNGNKVVYGADGKTPAWSWIYVMSFDIQNKRMSRAAHSESCAGGYKSIFKADNEEMYNKFFTQQAIQRLGRV